jgi:hypothetical protein
MTVVTRSSLDKTKIRQERRAGQAAQMSSTCFGMRLCGSGDHQSPPTWVQAPWCQFGDAVASAFDPLPAADARFRTHLPTCQGKESRPRRRTPPRPQPS